MEILRVAGQSLCRPWHRPPYGTRVRPWYGPRGSAEGFNDRVRRTVSGVFHHISPHNADLDFNEIGFRWSQRAVTGQAPRPRKGRPVTKTLWARIPPALQLPAVFRSAV